MADPIGIIPGLNPVLQDPVGVGSQSFGRGTPLPAPGDSSGAWSPMMGDRRRRSGPLPGVGTYGSGQSGPDPQMIAHLIEMFSRLGGMGGGGQQMGGVGQGMAPGIPHFAQGGVVSRPTIGLLGENGPEAVVPLSGQQMGFQGGQMGGGQMGGSSPWGMQRRPSSFLSPGGLTDYYQTGAIGAAGKGGAFGLNPPQGIMDAVRQQAIQDAGAQSRSARLGLMGQTTVDPSTYGYQSLISDLQGQGNVANSLNGANLALRQQQAEFLQKLLMQAIGGQQQIAVAKASQPKQGFGASIGGVGVHF